MVSEIHVLRAMAHEGEANFSTLKGRHNEPHLERGTGPKLKINCLLTHAHRNPQYVEMYYSCDL